MRPRREWLRWAGPAAFAAGSTLMIAFAGLPTAKDRLFAWLLAGMVLCSLVDVRRTLPRLVLEWSPFIGFLLAYDLLRGVADSVFAAHVWPQLRVDEWLFAGSVPSVWLQQHMWHGEHDLRWWDYAAWGVYLTHFFATLVVAALLWLWWHDRFLRYAVMVATLAALGFATYVLFPAVPPWLASEDGFLEPTTRLVPIVWSHIPIEHFATLFEKGRHYANDVAAVPSLHAAYALLITLYLWRLVPRWARVPLAVYPLAMSWALVYGAEHYVSDCLLGWVYAVAAYLGVNAVAERWPARRRQESAAVFAAD
ncbi:MAG TPA: phosphatase PAP2 family protein [Gaiellaceae bacterium]